MPGEHRVLGFVSSNENHQQQKFSELEDKVEEIHFFKKNVRKNTAKYRNTSKRQSYKED